MHVCNGPVIQMPIDFWLAPDASEAQISFTPTHLRTSLPRPTTACARHHGGRSRRPRVPLLIVRLPSPARAHRIWLRGGQDGTHSFSYKPLGSGRSADAFRRPGTVAAGQTTLQPGRTNLEHSERSLEGSIRGFTMGHSARTVHRSTLEHREECQ